MDLEVEGFAALLVVLVFVEAWTAQVFPSINDMPVPAVRVLIAFTMGVLLSLATARRSLNGARSWLVVIALVALLVVPPLTDERGPKAAIGLVLCIASIGLTSVATGPIARMLRNRSMVLGGHISYSLHLLHIPLLMVLVRVFRPDRVADLPMVLRIALVILHFVIALALAWVAYRCIESPARRWLLSGGVRRAALRDARSDH